jgi:hypothetical protein
MFKLLSSSLFILVVLLVFAGCKKTEEAKEEAPTAALTDEQVVQTIEDYIASNLAADSTFAVEDPLENRTRNLKLDYVHTTVRRMDDGKYYACADMSEGTQKLDLDFYVVVEDGKPKVSDVVIHKVDGVSRK